MKKFLIPAVIIIVLTSCNNYYKAIVASDPAKAGNIENLKMQKKYFILRSGGQAFAMNNISVSADQKTIQCTLDSLPIEHMLYSTKGAKNKMKYKDIKSSDENESGVLNEVHLYVNPNANIAVGNYTLLLEQVQKIEILEKDKAKTRASYGMGMGIGIGAAVLVAAGVFAIIASSITIGPF